MWASGGWSLLWAVLSAELVLAGFGLQQSPGGTDTLLEFVVGAMLVGSLLYLPGVFLWLLIVAAVFTWCNFRSGPSKLLIMLFPQIVGGVALAWALLLNPPSPHAFFLRKFGVALPTDARAIRVRGHLIVDSGNVGYYVQSNRESAQLLIERLHLKAVPTDDARSRETVQTYVLPNIGSDADGWPGKREYFRRDGNTGTGYFMICNEAMTEFLLARDPLAFKTDAELGGQSE